MLGDTGSEVRRLQKDRAWRDEIATQVGKRHAQRVIDAWSRQLDALALAPGTDADGASRQATELTAPDSPLRRLLTRLADEFSATAQGGSAAEAAFDGTLRARFGALGDYAAGAGPQALDRLHALATVKRDETADAELDATLRAEAARAPAALRKVYVGLGTMIRSRGGAKPSFDAALAELAQTCSALTRERFPFGAAALRDMAPSDFARLFGPGGLFDEFRRNQLTERVDTSSRPWKARSAPADASMPGAFEQAAAIGALFFPGGAPLPELKLRLTPQRMDDALLQFSIDVDGQLLRFENGPPRGKELVWPGPASTQKVLMRILPPGPGGVGAEVHEGPFAWLRVLLRGDWKGERGAPARLAFVVDTRTLDVEASASGAPEADIWTLRELARFSLPAANMVKLSCVASSWYGKLPARGDFVGRGLPPRWRSDWDGWLQRGLALAATTLDDAALRERLRAFAPWRYLALPAPGEIWCGIIVASHDRVGRAFPLTLAERLAATGVTARKRCTAGVAAWRGSRRARSARGGDRRPAAALRSRNSSRPRPGRRNRPASGGRSTLRTMPFPGWRPGHRSRRCCSNCSIFNRRTPDRERRIVVLVAAVGLLHTRFEAIEPGLNAAAADHAARHRNIVEGRPEAVAAQQQRIAGGEHLGGFQDLEVEAFGRAERRSQLPRGGGGRTQAGVDASAVRGFDRACARAIGRHASGTGASRRHGPRAPRRCEDRAAAPRWWCACRQSGCRQPAARRLHRWRPGPATAARCKLTSGWSAKASSTCVTAARDAVWPPPCPPAPSHSTAIREPAPSQ